MKLILIAFPGGTIRTRILIARIQDVALLELRHSK